MKRELSTPQVGVRGWGITSYHHYLHVVLQLKCQLKEQQDSTEDEASKSESEPSGGGLLEKRAEDSSSGAGKEDGEEKGEGGENVKDLKAEVK